MGSCVGTMSIGVRAPIIRQGDKLPQIVADSVIRASKQIGLEIEDGDVIAVTESVVARAEGNYVTVDDIAKDVSEKYGDHKVALIHPILSRNRFAMCLKGICRGARNGGVVLVLSLPADEVGNHLVPEDEYRNSALKDLSVVDEKTFRKTFKSTKHGFTGVDYVEYYKSIAKAEKCNMDVIFSNDPKEVLKYTNYILCCDIHTRKATQDAYNKAGAFLVRGLDDICSTPKLKTGFNPSYGLLGSNKADEERVKLLPKECDYLLYTLQNLIHSRTGKNVEVLVYGDGAFKDPVGKIWELADPVVGVAYTPGLRGRPNELKLKNLADEKFAGLEGEELKKAMIKEIRAKDSNLVGKMSAQGTTPRQFTDLLGSLADLTSGSGDKGTPIVWIKNYFNNYADNN